MFCNLAVIVYYGDEFLFRRHNSTFYMCWLYVCVLWIYWRLKARLLYLQCVSSEDTTVLYKAVDIVYMFSFVP